MIIGHRLSALRVARTAVIAAFLGLGGCGGGVDGVEFNGKIFDAVGMTGALGKKAEPKTEPRAPLVLPPSTERLPQPGEFAAAEPAPTDPAWPNDREKARGDSEAKKKQAQEAYCRDGNWKDKAMREDAKVAAGQSECGSIFSVLGKQLFGN
ncbi:MAG: hypothetical protein AB7O57_22180 [Hyphomicrobiaceae bacterium]